MGTNDKEIVVFLNEDDVEWITHNLKESIKSLKNEMSKHTIKLLGELNILHQMRMDYMEVAIKIPERILDKFNVAIAMKESTND